MSMASAIPSSQSVLSVQRLLRTGLLTRSAQKVRMPFYMHLCSVSAVRSGALHRDSTINAPQQNTEMQHLVQKHGICINHSQSLEHDQSITGRLLLPNSMLLPRIASACGEKHYRQNMAKIPNHTLQSVDLNIGVFCMYFAGRFRVQQPTELPKIR